MASTIIHMCVAKKLNKIIKKDENAITLGSIAPDISKLIGKSKVITHFLDDDTSGIPNLEKFLSKYQQFLNDNFVLGYYIHLYTGYIWFKYFIPDFAMKGYVYEKDGKKVQVTEEELIDYIYKDYSNLNVKLIDEYELDLKLYYGELNINFKPIIKEIPTDHLDILINEAGLLIQNSTESKPIIFDVKEITKFVDLTVNAILDNLKDLKIS